MFVFVTATRSTANRQAQRVAGAAAVASLARREAPGKDAQLAAAGVRDAGEDWLGSGPQPEGAMLDAPGAAAADAAAGGGSTTGEGAEARETGGGGARIQTRLRVSNPDDPEEREADAMAERVMAAPAVGADTPPPAAGDGEDIQRSARSTLWRRAAAAATLWRDFLDGMGPREESVEAEAPAVQAQPLLARLAQDGATQGQAGRSLEARLGSSRSGGQALSPALRERMEPGYGADFSGVRVHTDADAVGMAGDVSARAFTYGSHIYFNQGEYAPDTGEGQRLLAHELTHVVQQGAAPAAESGGAQSAASASAGSTLATSRVQRVYIPGISEALDAAGEFIVDRAWGLVRRFAPSLEPILRRGPINWLRDQVTGVFRGVVSRFNALVPAGAIEQLTTVFGGLVERATTIVNALLQGNCEPLMQGLRQLRSFVTEIAGAAWDRLTEFLRPIGDFFSSLWNNFGAPAVEAIQAFAGDLWERIQQLGRDIWEWTRPIRDSIAAAWNWVKEQLFGPEDASQGESSGGIVGWIGDKLGQAWDWVKDQTRPVWEPIAGAVETVRSLIPPAFIRNLGEQFQQMSGQLSETAGAMGEGGDDVAANREALAGVLPSVQQVLQTVRGVIVGARAWLVSTVTSMGARLSGFVAAVRASVLSFLANPLGWLENLGSRLINWVSNGVGRLFDWVLRGFDFLSPFVERILGVVRRVISVVGDVMQLPMLVLSSLWNLIPACIRNPIKDFLINTILRNIPVFSSLLDLPDIWARLQATAMRILRQVFVDGNLAGAAWTFFSSMLRVLGIPAQLVVQILAKAASAIGSILTNPIGFLLNLMRAMRAGFERFFGNIGRHLLGGIAGWLFGHMSEAGITPPTEFSLRGILGVILQILDITMERIFRRLAERVGQPIVDRLRRALDVATGVWNWISILVREGPGGLWRELQSRLSNLWQSVIGGVIRWVTTTIVTRVTARLLSMLDPSGVMAVVNSLIAIYRAIQSFIQYLNQMLQIVNRVLDGINGIATGAIDAAAGFLENALSRAIPIAIGFLANQVGLGNLGTRVREMVEAVRARVDQAIDWLIDRAIRGGQALLNLLRRGAAAVAGGVRRIGEWWRARKQFRATDGSSHSLYFQGSGGSAQLIVRSEPQEFGRYLAGYSISDNDPQRSQKQTARTQAQNIYQQIQTLKNRGQAQDAQTGEAQQQFQTLLDQLAVPAAVLMPTGAGNIPESTPPVYGGLTGGYGSLADVARLTSNGSGGSEPSITSPSYEILNQRRNPEGSGSFYVKGHLINHNLHGPGNTWQNLTPLTQWANNRGGDSHLHSVETPVKQAVDAGHIVHYRVQAVYGRSVNASLIQAFEQSNDPQKRIKQDIVREEAKVPFRLVCSATVVASTATGGGGNLPRPLFPTKSVENDLRQSSPDNYRVAAEAVRVRTLTRLGVNSAIAAGDAWAFSQVAGIGEQRSGDLAGLRGRGPFPSWNSLAEALAPGTDAEGNVIVRNLRADNRVRLNGAVEEPA